MIKFSLVAFIIVFFYTMIALALSVISFKIFNVNTANYATFLAVFGCAYLAFETIDWVDEQET